MGGPRPRHTPLTSSLAGTPFPRSVRSARSLTLARCWLGGFAPAAPHLRAHSRGPLCPAPFARRASLSLARSRSFIHEIANHQLANSRGFAIVWRCELFVVELVVPWRVRVAVVGP